MGVSIGGDTGATIPGFEPGKDLLKGLDPQDTATAAQAEMKGIAGTVDKLLSSIDALHNVLVECKGELDSANPILVRPIRLANDQVIELRIYAPGTDLSKVDKPKMGGNLWLSATPLTVFRMAFFNMMAMMQQTKAVEKQLDISAMNQVWDLANASADAIMDAAKAKAMQHIGQAIVAGMQVAMTVAMGMKQFGAKKGAEGDFTKQNNAFKADVTKTNPNAVGASGQPLANRPANTPANIETHNAAIQTQKSFQANQPNFISQNTTNRIMTWTTASQAVQGMGQMLDQSIQAGGSLQIGYFESLKEVIQGAQQIARKSMDSAAEGYKGADEAISQLLQALTQLVKQLFEAIKYTQH